MPRAQERNILWQRLDAPGLEHLRLLIETKGSIADGLVISVENGRAFRLQYRVSCDAQWQCLGAEINLLGEGNGKLTLTKEFEENWIANGKAVKESVNCIDIDVSATPFTNTLPIRRLNLQPGQSSEISALYILIPDLTLSVVKQIYRCLGQSQGGATYVYQGLDGRAYRVIVDGDGLVTEYEGIFRRL
jgi:uncharacterized protein